VACTGSGLWTGWTSRFVDPVCLSFILSFPLPTFHKHPTELPKPIANPVHGAPNCSLNFCSPASVCRIHSGQHRATNAVAGPVAALFCCGSGTWDFRRLRAGTPFCFWYSCAHTYIITSVFLSQNAPAFFWPVAQDQSSCAANVNEHERT
jgi:hypothetical protein